MPSDLQELFINTDGGARGNPGPAAVGFVVINSEKNVVFEQGTRIGDQTNNTAEYQAVIHALNWVLKHFNNPKQVRIRLFLDSNLVVNQLNGVFKIKQHHLLLFSTKVKMLEKNFDLVSYNYIPRKLNSRADSLVNKALDELAT